MEPRESALPLCSVCQVMPAPVRLVASIHGEDADLCVACWAAQERGLEAIAKADELPDNVRFAVADAPTDEVGRGGDGSQDDVIG